MVSKKKLLIRSATGLLVILIVIQCFRPERNLSADTANDISRKYPVPERVQTILKSSCYDCHSNHTDYPWYANIQPVAWWLDHHINEGKGELNFNNFTSYRISRQYHKLEKVAKEVNEGEMPINTYTLIHRYAALDEGQRKLLSDWANALRDSIRASYPADSLKMQSRRKS